MQTVLTAKANRIWQKELNKNVIKEFSLPTSTCFVVQWAYFPTSLPLFLDSNHKNVTVSIFSLLVCFTGTIPQLTRRLLSAPGNLYSLLVSLRCNRNKMRNAQHRRTTAKQHKPGNTGVGIGGLLVSTFSFSAYSLNVFANTSPYLCRCFAGH